MTEIMKIGNREFAMKGRTYCMGILNVTPDSFSDGGKWAGLDAALAHTERMIEEGADLVDVGGESTRPGYTLIPDAEEIDRVVPVIEAIKARFDIPVSLDTYKSAVAEAGARAGADLLNDIWGFRRDGNMAKIAARYGLPVCLMHNRDEAVYTDFLADVLADLAECVRIAIGGGVEKSHIILDPGVGFGKTLEQNLAITNRVETLFRLGCPVLLGTSRKSMIGKTLNLPVTERVEGTIATTVLAVTKGIQFVRVHDVAANVRAIRMTEAVLAAK